MNYITAVCPHCGAEFTAERGRTYLCPMCDNMTVGDITAYELPVETGRALFSADIAFREGDTKGAFKLYKAAAKTDKKNPTPLLGMLFCKYGVKYEKGKFTVSSGKLLTRAGLCKKMMKISSPERKRHYMDLLYKVCVEPRVKIARSPKPSNINDFAIKDGELRYYKGEEENIVIPPSVKRITCYAFLTAKSVKSVYIPASVEKIDEQAFTSEPTIERITVDPASERFASDGGCLIDVTRSAVLRGGNNASIPEYVTSIDEYAFERCTDLTEINIPNGVTFVGEYAFGGCEKLKRVIIPASLTEIEDGAFSFCHDIAEFDVDGGNDTYCQRDGALYDIAENKVLRCGADGKIPSGTKVLGESSFDGGTFAELHIPATVTEICDRALDGCDKLAKITVDKNNPVYTSAGGCLIDKSACTLVTAVGDYNIPDDGSVKIIGESAFRYCLRKTVEIPSSIQVIDDTAFADGEFEQIIFNDGLEVIGDNAFTRCINIKAVKLPDTLISIGEEAFENCENLKSVVIPASVECIDKDAFCFCDELESAVFEKTDGWLYDGDGSDPVDAAELSDAHRAADILKDGRKISTKV